MPVPALCVPQREKRLGPVGDRLTDSHEDAGGERNAVDAGILDNPKPEVGILVGGAVVHLSRGLEQVAGCRLEHHAHRRPERAQALEFVGTHDAGVQMREHACLGRDEVRDVRDIVEGRGETVLVEPAASLGPPLLGAITEREERLFAALALSGPGDGEHLFRAHEHRLSSALQLPRGVDENAIVAAVAAQGRDGDEHFAGVREDARAPSLAQAAVAQRAGDLENGIQLRTPRAEHRDQIVAAEVVARIGS